MAGAKLPILQIKWAMKSPTLSAMFWATQVHTDNVKCTVYYAVIVHWALDAYVVFLLTLCLPCCVLGEYMNSKPCVLFLSIGRCGQLVGSQWAADERFILSNGNLGNLAGVALLPLRLVSFQSACSEVFLARVLCPAIKDGKTTSIVDLMDQKYQSDKNKNKIS